MSCPSGAHLPANAHALTKIPKKSIKLLKQDFQWLLASSAFSQDKQEKEPENFHNNPNSLGILVADLPEHGVRPLIHAAQGLQSLFQ